MNIVVLCGGSSTEREVSITSGLGVCRALRSKGHRAIMVDAFFGIPVNGAFLTGEEPMPGMDVLFPASYDPEAAEKAMRDASASLETVRRQSGRGFFGPYVIAVSKAAHIVFLALHGENGENGKVQAALDLNDVRYTGAGYLGSAIAMDKGLTKMILTANHLPAPHGVRLKRDNHLKDLAAYTMKFPVVVKPNSGGSSVGVTIVHDQEEYEKALKAAFELEDEVIVEDYIKGREFAVSVIDGKALPIIEIAPIEGFYDYNNKYTPGAAIETCPANLPHRLTERMQRYAEEGFEALMLMGYARFDFMMNENGDIFCLEANTLPGMTPTSLLPQEAEQVGMDFATLCEELIRVSLKRYH